MNTKTNIPKSIALSILLTAAIGFVSKSMTRSPTVTIPNNDQTDTVSTVYSAKQDLLVVPVKPIGEDTTSVTGIINNENELLSLSYRYTNFSDREKALYQELKTAIRSHSERYDMIGKYTLDEISFIQSSAEYPHF